MTGPTVSSRLLLVSDIVAGLDADEWCPALERAGWSGPVHVHEHPGRTGDVPLVGGNHEVIDPAFALGGSDAIGSDVVVVGFGRSGAAAQLVGLGGRAAAVVTVDGLGGPFVSPAEQIGATLATMRAVLADEQAHAAPGPGMLDPRLSHGLTAHGDEETASRMAAAMPVPMLVIETPMSAVEDAEVERIASLTVSTKLVRLGEAGATAVAETLVGWVGAQR